MPYPLRSYLLMLKWEALRLKVELPIMLIIQSFVGAGTVVGLGYLFPQIDPVSAAYVSTGAASLVLMITGLIAVPQRVAQGKLDGTHDYLASLPVPRMAHFAAELTIWIVAALPSVVVALVVASLRYDFTLRPRALAIPALVLVALTSASVGYAIAHLSPSPLLTNLLSQVLIFALFMFSPVNFPIERLPAALAKAHRVLPVKYMADLVRGTLTDLVPGGTGLAFAVVLVWCVAGVALTSSVVNRRG